MYGFRPQRTTFAGAFARLPREVDIHWPIGQAAASVARHNQSPWIRGPRIAKGTEMQHRNYRIRPPVRPAPRPLSPRRRARVDHTQRPANTWQQRAINALESRAVVESVAGMDSLADYTAPVSAFRQPTRPVLEWRMVEAAAPFIIGACAVARLLQAL